MSLDAFWNGVEVSEGAVDLGGYVASTWFWTGKAGAPRPGENSQEYQ